MIIIILLIVFCMALAAIDKWLHHEEHRECLSCHHKWHADRYLMKPSVTPLASQALYGIGAAGVTSKQVHKYQLWEKYARCPQCGTTKVRTLK